VKDNWEMPRTSLTRSRLTPRRDPTPLQGFPFDVPRHLKRSVLIGIHPWLRKFFRLEGLVDTTCDTMKCLSMKSSVHP